MLEIRTAFTPEPENFQSSALALLGERVSREAGRVRGSRRHLRGGFLALILASGVLVAGTNAGHAQTTPQAAKKPSAKKPAPPASESLWVPHTVALRHGGALPRCEG
jgi:hypothetical protein